VEQGIASAHSQVEVTKGSIIQISHSYHLSIEKEENMGLKRALLYKSMGKYRKNTYVGILQCISGHDQ
jgi:hypothetical protein